MTVPVDLSQTTGGVRPLHGSVAPRGGDGAELTKAGEAFERALLGQLTKTLADSAFGGEDATSAAAGAYQDLLPEALTHALVAGGGIGLARALDRGPLG